MNYTYNNTDKTESYIYVIVIVAPILCLLSLHMCIRCIYHFCHGGTCCIEAEDYNYDIDVINESIKGDINIEADEIDEVDDRFDGFDNISI
jgi:hypothetical protein